MCRWFAYISDSEPALLEDVLVRPAHSITKQVHSSYLPKLFHHNASKKEDEDERKFIVAHNKFVNVDGTGVAFYTSSGNEYGQVEGLRPQLYKSIQPPTNDPNLMSLCSNQASTVIFAHIRMATSIVVPTNSHPFIFGRHSFMHNGTIATFGTSPTLKRRILAAMSDKAAGHILGSTDSEHLAGLYFTYLGEDYERTYSLDEMKTALEKAISTVIGFQREEAGPNEIIEPSSLNLCTTDGKQLLAFRFRNSPLEEEQPPSLYYSTTAGPTLNRKFEGHPDQVSKDSNVHPEEHGHPYGPHGLRHWNTSISHGKDVVGTKSSADHGKHVIVASEPTTFDQNQWNLIPKNGAVLVAGNMEPKLEKINVTF